MTNKVYLVMSKKLQNKFKNKLNRKINHQFNIINACLNLINKSTVLRK